MSSFNVYTSYYARAKNLDASYLLISVSNTSPEWFKSPLHKLRCPVFPKWSLINEYKAGSIPYSDFVKRYLIELEDTVDVNDIRKEISYLVEYTGCSNVVLLCWEKDGNSCHRMALAKHVFECAYRGEL